MPITLHTPTGEPEEPDRPAPAAAQPYWRDQSWRPPGYRDTSGALADLARRLATRLLGLRWRLSFTAVIDTLVHAPNEDTARLAVTDALRHRDTVIALSRAQPGEVPPWRPLGTADHVDPRMNVHAVEAGDGAWQCTTMLLLSFTVDVADAGWPDRDFVVDVVPARTQPRLRDTEAAGTVLMHRRPTRAPQHPQPGQAPTPNTS